MIYHYVNLAGGWEVIEGLDLDENDRVLADTISTSALASILLGKKIKRNSGPYSAKRLLRKKINYCAICSISTDFTDANPNFFVAPKKIEDPFKFGQQIAPKLEAYEYILIGISTPKQNVIAKGIASVNSNAKIFNYGVVIDDLILGRKIPGFWGKFGLEWLYRYSDLRRNIPKQSATIFNVFKILFVKSYRDSFLTLSKRFYSDQEHDYD